jgi:CxxC-x17-CxxC domain-containing protein
MEFADRVLTCVDCGGEFLFSKDEQAFFRDKEFVHDPRHCKKCMARRHLERKPIRFQAHVNCAECGIATVVPFLPFEGRPVLCRDCFRKKQQTA